MTSHFRNRLRAQCILQVVFSILYSAVAAHHESLLISMPFCCTCNDALTMPSCYSRCRLQVVFTIHNMNYGQKKISEAAYYCQKFTTVSPTYAFEVGLHALQRNMLLSYIMIHS